jgi:serine/threonine-protein kinase HipA
MALKLNGKDQRLRRSDFMALAKIADLGATSAKSAIDGLVRALATALEGFSLPPRAQADTQAQAMTERVLEIVRARVADFD